MGFSKRQFVEGAFEELGLASYVFDIGPEELDRAMRRLDSMMAEWNGKGIRLGYPIPGNPEDNDLDEPSGVPDSANEAIIGNLAIRIAPTYGKTVSPETRSTAKMAYNTVLQRACYPPEMQLGMIPAGAGNKPIAIDGGVFLPPPDTSIDAGSDGAITFE